MEQNQINTGMENSCIFLSTEYNWTLLNCLGAITSNFFIFPIFLRKSEKIRKHYYKIKINYLSIWYFYHMDHIDTSLCNSRYVTPSYRKTLAICSTAVTFLCVIQCWLQFCVWIISNKQVFSLRNTFCMTKTNFKLFITN